MVLPVYLTGEPAEEVVEHLPGVAESFIESHEDAAKFSLILTLATGALAFVALWFQKSESRRRLVNFGVMGLATVAFLSLAYTANLGGKIRHSELRMDSAPQSDGAPSAQEVDGDTDGDDD
jgi:predicted RND superfamily exporter protein